VHSGTVCARYLLLYSLIARAVISWGSGVSWLYKAVSFLTTFKEQGTSSGCPRVSKREKEGVAPMRNNALGSLVLRSLKAVTKQIAL
jgi:hypothetical protein